MSMKFLLSFAVVFLILLSCLSAGCVDQTPTQEDVLADVIASLHTELSTTTLKAELAADSYASYPTLKNAQQILATLYQRTTLVHDMLIADENGIVIAVCPNNVKSTLGQDLSSYPPNKETFSHQDAYVSEFMRIENGMEAHLLSVPVEISGEYAGYISMSFDPYRLFGAQQQKVQEMGYNIWVMQPDGIQVFDVDISEAGVNLRTDPAYSVVKDTADLVAANPSGETTYVFTADNGTENVQKTAVWDTLTYGGREWRVVLTKSSMM